MKIKISDYVPEGHDKSAYLSVEEITPIIQVLEDSHLFWNWIKFSRNHFNISEELYGKPSIDYWTKMDSTKNENLIGNCDWLCIELNLPFHWDVNLRDYLYYDELTLPLDSTIVIEGNDSRKEEQFHYVDLILTQKISKTKLHQLIDRRWNEIEEMMNRIKLLNPINHKMKNIELTKKIISYKDIENKKFSEIADILASEEENIDISDSINEDYVKVIYHRWKKIINRNLGNNSFKT